MEFCRVHDIGQAPTLRTSQSDTEKQREGGQARKRETISGFTQLDIHGQADSRVPKAYWKRRILRWELKEVRLHGY